MTMFRAFLAPLAAALLLVVSGCSSTAPTTTAARPSFYDDLARPGARVDQQKMTEIISQYRVSNGGQPLALDPELSRIAQQYAENMARSDKMSHALNPYGTLLKRLRDGGYAYLTAGENIAAGPRTIANVFSEWRASPRHDAGMKDPEMTVMGIGAAYNPDSKYKVFWCLIVARPKPPEMQAAVSGPFAAQ
ncbi:CAP domain-containing protein [Methylobrevis pamukkalensis]|uniref:Cysteine-rich secretory protein family protein n=1 Tax=Methylobrevis pamukkalensis TaxID=1439726 RepID=A0A1E3H8T0_9HYPH|nr:CAP domain-containing protein [Methylobrevis pamukkalensis]ODN72545.1 Cysteine-rich secretory protein family protein [Methylobrevis pamukkalensis]